MTNVVLVCVAGVSGTFLARRMRDLDPSLVTTVTDLDSFASVAADADVVLVAPQIAGALDRVTRLAGSTPLAVLPPSAYSGPADIAVRTTHDLLEGRPTTLRERPTIESKE